MLDNKQPHYFLGIDGGGSKCKAVVVSKDNTILGTGTSGPANPLHGFEQATNSITASALFALEDAQLADIPLANIIAGVGLAGVNLPRLFDEISSWQHPFKQLFLATDLFIACLGAHRGGEGAVLITGTGSCGFSYVDGHAFIIGAHGFPHGDKGSGAWFGLQAAKQVLLSIDGVVAPTIMSPFLLKKLNCHNDIALVDVIAGKPASFFAQLAHVVFDAAEQGDIVAKSIIEQGAHYINHMTQTLSDKNPPRMSMIGGLAPRLKPWLSDKTRSLLSEPLNPPEMGAVLFAKRQLGLQ